MKTQPWYIAGLHFECLQCGRCCSGPEEGYIWITDKETALAAENLGISEKNFKSRYTEVEDGCRTLIEEKKNNDCIFLVGKKCRIYCSRPNQCRTWPFWDSNLATADDWGFASMRCPGINRGKLYTYRQIEAIRTSRKWWDD